MGCSSPRAASCSPASLRSVFGDGFDFQQQIRPADTRAHELEAVGSRALFANVASDEPCILIARHVHGG